MDTRIDLTVRVAVEPVKDNRKAGLNEPEYLALIDTVKRELGALELPLDVRDALLEGVKQKLNARMRILGVCVLTSDRPFR